jgi:carbon storage regulator
MLVLSRQRDETIMIGDDIEITVVDIRGDKVRLGINAPSRIAVHRKEVYDAIRQENVRAAQVARTDIAGIRLPGALPAAGAPATVGQAGEAGVVPVISPGPLRDRVGGKGPAHGAELGRTGTDPGPSRRRDATG